jgi:hypothetical protein
VKKEEWLSIRYKNYINIKLELKVYV